jgi:uncharacterized protein (DUF2384 family)
MKQIAGAAHPDEGRVLTTALNRIVDLWRLTNEQLGSILGVSAAQASRLKNQQVLLARGTKQFELTQYLVRLFRSLDSIVGSDDKAARSWLAAYNLDLEGRPIDMLPSIRGLIRVCDYVDAFRARV